MRRSGAFFGILLGVVATLGVSLPDRPSLAQDAPMVLAQNQGGNFFQRLFGRRQFAPPPRRELFPGVERILPQKKAAPQRERRARAQPQPRAVWNDPAAEPGLRVSRLETRVEMVQAYTGMDCGLLDYLCGRDPRGLAVIAFGRGNVPPAIVPALQRVLDAGVIITVSSRCVAGRVSPRYGYEGGGLQLQRMGAVLAGDLSGAKARLLLMVVLGTSRELSQVKARLLESL